MRSPILDICGTRIALRISNARQRGEVAGRYRFFLTRRPPDLRIDVRMISLPYQMRMHDPIVESDPSGDALVIRRYDFHLDLSFKTGKGRLVVADRLTALDSLLRVLYTVLLIERDGFLIHAAGLKWGRAGRLFPGVSGGGKTTLARLAGEERVLSDEITGVRRGARGWRVMGTPFWGEFSAGRLNLDLPLKGVFFLNRHAKRGCRPLAADEAAARLLESTLFFSNDLARNRRLMEVAARLVRDLPTYELSYDRRESDIHDVMRLVRGVAR